MKNYINEIYDSNNYGKFKIIREAFMIGKNINERYFKIQFIDTGYYGVHYKDGAYCTKINNEIYGRFSIPEAAANLFNYLYPNFKNEFNNIEILNNVTPIPFEDLPKYAINKNNYVDSTTILLWSTT